MLLPRWVVSVVLAAVAATIVSTAPVVAQDDVGAARSHFTRGTRLYEVGDYRQALEEFKNAHVAKPDPAFLFDIAQCHR